MTDADAEKAARASAEAESAALAAATVQRMKDAAAHAEQRLKIDSHTDVEAAVALSLASPLDFHRTVLHRGPVSDSPHASPRMIERLMTNIV